MVPYFGWESLKKKGGSYHLDDPRAGAITLSYIREYFFHYDFSCNFVLLTRTAPSWLSFCSRGMQSIEYETYSSIWISVHPHYQKALSSSLRMFRKNHANKHSNQHPRFNHPITGRPGPRIFYCGMEWARSKVSEVSNSKA